MSFLDIRFPPAISYNAIGGPGFLTNVVPVNSGAEFRDSVWSLERGEWEVSHAARLPDAYRPLQAFFRVVKGRAYSFRYKDWSDFSASITEGIFVTIDSTHRQAHKRYTFGSQTFDRKITKLATTPTLNSGTGTWDLTTGILTITSGAPTSASFEFDCHCRFDTDKMKAETIAPFGPDFVIGWASIPIIEVRG